MATAAARESLVTPQEAGSEPIVLWFSGNDHQLDVGLRIGIERELPKEASEAKSTVAPASSDEMPGRPIGITLTALS